MDAAVKQDAVFKKWYAVAEKGLEDCGEWFSLLAHYLLGRPCPTILEQHAKIMGLLVDDSLERELAGASSDRFKDGEKAMQESLALWNIIMANNALANSSRCVALKVMHVDQPVSFGTWRRWGLLLSEGKEGMDIKKALAHLKTQYTKQIERKWEELSSIKTSQTRRQMPPIERPTSKLPSEWSEEVRQLATLHTDDLKTRIQHHYAKCLTASPHFEWSQACAPYIASVVARLLHARCTNPFRFLSFLSAIPKLPDLSRTAAGAAFLDACERELPEVKEPVSITYTNFIFHIGTGYLLRCINTSPRQFRKLVVQPWMHPYLQRYADACLRHAFGGWEGLLLFASCMFAAACVLRGAGKARFRDHVHSLVEAHLKTSGAAVRIRVLTDVMSKKS